MKGKDKSLMNCKILSGAIHAKIKAKKIKAR